MQKLPNLGSEATRMPLSNTVTRVVVSDSEAVENFAGGIQGTGSESGMVAISGSLDSFPEVFC